MKKITQFSVKYPVTVLMIVLAVILLGYISFTKLGIDLFPNLNNPEIYIELTAGEKPPEELEKKYIESIESMAIRQNDVAQVSSVTKVGSSIITVEYNWGKDMDEAFLDLQRALASYTQDDEIDVFNISQHDPNASPVLIVGIKNENIQDMNELRKVADNYIRNELVRLEGIADVQLSGQEIAEVLIETDIYKLEAFNLTPSTIVQQIQNYNRNVSGGSIVEMGKKYIVKGVSLLNELEDLKNIIVGYKSATENASSVTEQVPVYLKDVASVSFKNKDPENLVRINGDRCIGLSIYKETKYNTVKAVNQLQEEFTKIQKALPGYEFTIVQNQGDFISSAIGEVQDTALIGIVFAVFVLFIFLRRLGTTLIVSLAIPISIIATFNLMYFNGLTLNIMTLGGLALGAGMLVDNAIIVMESIFRKLEEGMSLKDAAIHGTATVGGAITASTITTIIVFLPIVYLHGASGELFKDQAWTVAFSLISSLFVAILVIPMLVTKIFKPGVEKKKIKSVQFKGYSKFLGKVIKWRIPIIILTALFVGGSVLLIPIIGSEFLPKADTGSFTVKIKLAEGTSLERTSGTLENIENMVHQITGDELDLIYTHVGSKTTSTASGNSLFEGDNTGEIKVFLKADHEISSDKYSSELTTYLESIEGMEVEIVQDESALNTIMGTTEAPLIVEISGEELDIIEEHSNQIKEKMLSIPGLYNVKTSLEAGAPEIDIKVDRVQAGIHNVSIDAITTALQDHLSGREAGSFDDGGELSDISIKLPDVSVSEVQDIIISSGNSNVRLDEIADIELGNAPKEIIRRNQTRISKIYAHVDENVPLDHAVKQIQEIIDDYSFPAKYKAEITGEELKRKESMGSLSFALILAIILVYMVMASQFESLIHPFTILLTIPLAGVGTIAAFFLLGMPLNMMAFIGIIMLVGIAVNDSIILVDAINQFKAQGLSRIDAIKSAGEIRIRPIIMTSLTTILALLPLTIGFGEGAALRAPMAVAVIGGLITSTILTLIVIPCFYYILDFIPELFSGRKKMDR